MSSSASQNTRPVLPSIQDLLSDRDFDKLRLQSPEPVPRIATASIAISQPMARESNASSRHDPSLRSSCSPPIPPSHSPKLRSRTVARSAPYPIAHPSRSPRLPETAGKAFEGHLPGLHLASHFSNTRPGLAHELGQLNATHHGIPMDLPTYVLSADQCPPDDDRRHGCGICHRRFNRPSSLMIHMNSHTGAQPFKCPFPGCTRRFSVNSNMRRHYRNHREGAALTAQAQPYHPAPPIPSPPSPPPTPPRSSSSYRVASPPTRPYYSASSASPSPLSSPSHTDDGHFDAPTSASAEPPAYAYLYARSRERSRSSVLPRPHPRPSSRSRAQDRPSGGARPRACTMPGCGCELEAPGALRPAFSFSRQQGREHHARSSPKHR